MKIFRSTLGLKGVVQHPLLSTCAVRCPAQTSQTGPSSKILFDFHSDFWVNLHDFLCTAALASVPRNASQATELNKGDEEESGQLSSEERAAWNAAVSYYRVSLIQRDLPFDQGMEEIKNRLEDAEASIDLTGLLRLRSGRCTHRTEDFRFCDYRCT